MPNLADHVTRESYSHECISAGWWPGGGPVPGAVFYSYMYPEPPGFAAARVGPEGAYYDPTIGAYVIPMRLPPLVFTATMAFFFFIINLSKWIPYAWLGLLDMRNMATSLALLPFAPIGVVVGVRLAHRIKPILFYRLVYAGMFLTGCKLVWDGFFQ